MNIISAASLTGCELKLLIKRTNEWAGPCPGCREGEDRFHAWPDAKGGKGTYWCRQCGIKGDTIDLLVNYAGYTQKQAFDAMGQSLPDNWKPAGHKPVMGGKNDKFSPRRYEDPTETWLSRGRDLVNASHEALLKFDRGLSWLADRGLDERAVRHFRLGWYSPGDGKACTFRPRPAWGLSKEIKENGRQRMVMVPRGFVIPTFKDGDLYRIRIRRPGGDVAGTHFGKYYVIPGSGMEALLINPDKKVLVVVESELDALLVIARAGSLVGVIGMGTATNRPGSYIHPVCEKAAQILVALDNDAAGQKGWEWWRDNFRRAERWPVPQGKDPGEAYQAGVDIKAWIEAGLAPVARMDYAPRGYEKPQGLSHMEELQQLLATYPVTLFANQDEARIDFDPGFKNRAIRHRIRQLFEKDEEVHWYLRVFHPDDVITGDNCRVVKGVTA